MSLCVRTLSDHQAGFPQWSETQCQAQALERHLEVKILHQSLSLMSNSLSSLVTVCYTVALLRGGSMSSHTVCVCMLLTCWIYFFSTNSFLTENATETVLSPQ